MVVGEVARIGDAADDIHLRRNAYLRYVQLFQRLFILPHAQIQRRKLPAYGTGELVVAARGEHAQPREQQPGRQLKIPPAGSRKAPVPDIKHFDEMVLLRAQFPACAGKEVHCLFVVPLNEMVNAQIGCRLFKQVRFFERLKRRIPAGHDSVETRVPVFRRIADVYGTDEQVEERHVASVPELHGQPPRPEKEPGKRRRIAARTNDERVHVTAKTPVPLRPIGVQSPQAHSQKASMDEAEDEIDPRRAQGVHAAQAQPQHRFQCPKLFPIRRQPQKRFDTGAGGPGQQKRARLLVGLDALHQTEPAFPPGGRRTAGERTPLRFSERDLGKLCEQFGGPFPFKQIREQRPDSTVRIPRLFFRHILLLHRGPSTVQPSPT